MPVSPSGDWDRELAWGDVFRWDPRRPTEPGYREWHHFCIATDAMDLVLNHSVVGGVERRPAAGQVSVLMRKKEGARRGDWSGGVARIRSDQIEVRGGPLHVTFGEDALSYEDGYRVHLSGAAGGVAGDIVFRPVTQPFSVNNVDSTGRSRLSWLVVPHLRATGRLTADGEVIAFEDVPSYHDHNWGLWGVEGVWDWGFGLPSKEGGCSAVYVRLHDRARTEVRVQALFLWEGAALTRIVRDEDLRFSGTGELVTPRLFKVPPALGLLAPGDRTGAPERLEIAYRDGGDRGVVRFSAESASLLLAPEERCPGVLGIAEISAKYEIEGVLSGRRVSGSGRGQSEHVTAR